MEGLLVSQLSSGAFQHLPRKLTRSSRQSASPACAAQPHSQPSASPDTQTRKKQHQQKLDSIKKHRSSLAEVRQKLEERSRQRSEGFDDLLGRVLLPLVKKAGIPGTLAACTAWLLHTDPFNHWTWNEDALNAILWISPVIAADFALLLTDFKPEPGRELYKVPVENFPNDKAVWEQDRAELLRLGIVDEDVLDQMEVVWGEQDHGRHGNRVSIGRSIRVEKPAGLRQATLTQIQQAVSSASSFASFPVPVAVSTTTLSAAAQELLLRFTILGGLAAWLTDRLYEAGLEDPSSLSDPRVPVAEFGQDLASFGVSNWAIGIAASICLRALWANRKSNRASTVSSLRVSEAAAHAVQHVDTRSAADFRAGKKPVSSQLAQQAESQPEPKSSSQPAVSGKVLETSELAAKARPEILQRLQKASTRNKVKDGIRGMSIYQQISKQLTAYKLADACSYLRFAIEWSLYGFLYFSSSGNLAVTFSANLARQLALLGPRQMTQRRAKEMLPEQLDIMLERDDTMCFLYEARQRLEVYFEEKLAREAQQSAVSEGGNAS
ncbi:hypothetical protein WJX74_008395 [Apatococcus lobatus]|uniref:Uncharacterized protein n=1 Tax=Apatococcus lobatus TaxID=904363 RepID=A0AAW1QVL1_9CHLO